MIAGEHRADDMEGERPWKTKRSRTKPKSRACDGSSHCAKQHKPATWPDWSAEQLAHFGIEPASAFGKPLLAACAGRLYEAQATWISCGASTLESIGGLDRSDRIAIVQRQEVPLVSVRQAARHAANPHRGAYQSLDYSPTTISAKGPYAVFDNVTAIFSAKPVIARTATYIYACAEWIDDAFQGKELLLEIYSRLLNPTSVSLANYIVDIEAGPYAREYFAWNFNSGMAAIDAVLAHRAGRATTF